MNARIEHGLNRVCLMVAAFFTLTFALVALLSMNYPFHLEWMEGQSIDVIKRISEGRAVYTKPSLEYVPFIYTPLYFYVSAAVSWLTGVDFLPARLVSTLSALGIGALIYGWVRKEGGNKAMGVIAAGLFFATYRFSGRWMDIARVDSLSLFLTLAGAYAYHHYPHWRGSLLAAIIWTAAFLTKQSALIVAAPILLIGLLLNPRHAILCGGLLAILIFGTVSIFNTQTEGWFSFFVFEVPYSHPILKKSVQIFWTHHMFTQCGIIFALSTLAILNFFSENRARALAYFAIAVGFVGSAYAALLHSGSYMNVLMPAHAALALLAGVFLTQMQRFNMNYTKTLAPMLLIVQMCGGFYNPVNMIPDSESVMLGERFLQSISKIKGDVMLPDLQFVQTRVGKKSYALGMAAFDIMRSDLGEMNALRREIGQQLQENVRGKKFGAVIPGMFYVRITRQNQFYEYKYNLAYPREYVTGGRGVANMEVYVPRRRGPKPPDNKEAPKGAPKP